MILVRHGQSEFNVVYGKTRIDPGIRDPNLTDLGCRQAHAAAEAMKGHDVRRLVTSPYTRAIQTATIIAEVLDLDIAVDQRIGERAAFTCDIGTPRSVLEKDWPQLQLDHIEEIWWPALEESEDALDARGRAFRTRMHEAGNWSGDRRDFALGVYPNPDRSSGRKLFVCAFRSIDRASRRRYGCVRHGCMLASRSFN